MKFRIFIIALVILLSNFLSAQAQSQPCGCADKEDLLNILNTTQIRLQEVQRQLDLTLAQEKIAGNSSTVTSEQVGALNELLRLAEQNVATKGYSEQTVNPGDCSIKRKGSSSDCVELINKHFHDVIQEACLANKSSRQPNQLYFTLMGMKTFLLTVMRAYREKLNFTLQMLKSLPKSCRPNNWFGYVVYQEVFTSSEVETTPPTDYGTFRSNGITRVTGIKGKYIGTVFVKEGKAVSVEGNASYNYDGSSVGSEVRNCTRLVNKTLVHTITYKKFAEGEGMGDANLFPSNFNLFIHPDKKTYDLSTRNLPKFTITGQSVDNSKITNTCDDKDRESNKTELYTSSVSAVGYAISNEKINPGSPDYLAGDRVDKPANLNNEAKSKTKTTTNSQEIRLRWMLLRLPAK